MSASATPQSPWEGAPLMSFLPLAGYPPEEYFDPYTDAGGLSHRPDHNRRDTHINQNEPSIDSRIEELEKVEDDSGPPTFPVPRHFTPPPPFLPPTTAGITGGGRNLYIPPPPPPGHVLLLRRRNDRLLFGCISVMILWPWAFFGTIYTLGGIQWSNGMAEYAKKNPHTVNFVVTLIGSLIRVISALLFSFAIVRFGQEWIAINNPHVTVFDVSLLTAFRSQSWVWGIDDLRHVFQRHRMVPIVLVGMCLGGFAMVPSGTAGLISPGTFNKATSLQGSELNFAPGDAECVTWLEANKIQNHCDWKAYKGMQYTTCLSENQMVDVLESGRGNMLSLIDTNPGTSSMSQLGTNDGLRFLGPIRGVLPIGPDGVPAFNNLDATLNPFDNPKKRLGMVSYNYTLEQQGLESNISCIYDPTSPIVATAFVPGQNLVLQYNATCDPALGLEQVLENVVTYEAVNSNNTLMFWACGSVASTVGPPSYTIYLRGRANYATAIGNITCTVSPIQPALFMTTFQSSPGYFTAIKVYVPQNSRVDNATYPRFIEYMLVGLGNVIWEAQNWESNLVAETVITMGVKSMGLAPYMRTDQYLRLYEAMIQGVLEYEATYSRLIYSTALNPPDSCIRQVKGWVSYEVVGWFASNDQAGFLVPMTLVNLASLAVLVAAIVFGKGEYDFDPTDTRPLLAALLERGRDSMRVARVEWTDEVRYSQLPIRVE